MGAVQRAISRVIAVHIDLDALTRRIFLFGLLKFKSLAFIAPLFVIVIGIANRLTFRVNVA